jgi:hypothetical protein
VDAPDVLLGIVIGLSALLLTFMIVRMRLRSTRRRRSPVQIPVRVLTEKHIPVVEVSDTLPPLYSEPVITPIPRREKRTFFVISMLQTIKDVARHSGNAISHSLLALYRGVRRIVQLIGHGVTQLVKAVVFLILAVLKCLRMLVVGLLAAGLAMAVGARAASRWIGRRALAFGRWTHPYLLKFDEWLEIRVRKSETWLRRTLIQYDWIRLARTILGEAKKSVIELRPKLIFATVRKRSAGLKEQ